MSLRLLALDLSLAGTGIAWNHHWRGQPELGCQTVDTRRWVPKGIDHRRIEQVRQAIKPFVDPAGSAPGHRPPDLVVIEWLPEVTTVDPVTGKVIGKGEATLRTAELHGVIKHWLHAYEVPYVEVNPTHLQIYATGSGSKRGETKVTKEQVRRAVTATYGKQVHIGDHNTADAVCLLAMACDAYGFPLVSVDQQRRRALASVMWPDLNSPTARAADQTAGGRGTRERTR
jgi:crossover junction endodeoxyribonuclease RuvC